MIVVPCEQVQGISGFMDDDSCTFDIFPHSVRLARNFKKDLRNFEKKRDRYTISNLKRPNLGALVSKFKPLKNRDPIANSESLQYS